jgi:hypothetical protein
MILSRRVNQDAGSVSLVDDVWNVADAVLSGFRWDTCLVYARGFFGASTCLGFVWIPGHVPLDVCIAQGTACHDRTATSATPISAKAVERRSGRL